MQPAGPHKTIPPRELDRFLLANAMAPDGPAAAALRALEAHVAREVMGITSSHSFTIAGDASSRAAVIFDRIQQAERTGEINPADQEALAGAMMALPSSFAPER